jgi:hypothetical protein
MIKLKQDGHAKQYWNGVKFVEFNRNNEYLATEEETKYLLACCGVSLVEEPKPTAEKIQSKIEYEEHAKPKPVKGKKAK